MSSLFASLAPFTGWIVAAILLIALIVVVSRRPPEQEEKKRQFPWQPAPPEDFEPTVMVDSGEVSTWHAASRQDMPPPRPAGPIRVSQVTQPAPLSENPGS
ncbi:MAG: hypothetical protein CFE44_05000 [Burkholderiales bacterium PBB4]|nr:MAG: hypothetical protein CFE44_05000 [Burkholderiales bacterium PBB4]